MKSIKEVLKGNEIKDVSKNSEDWFFEHGYVYSKAYGWEKPEYLERFGLNPNDECLPGQWHKEYETKTKRTLKRDFFGKKINEEEQAMEKIWTGRYVWGIKENYMAFKKWKEDRRRAWDLEDESFNNILS